MAFSREHAARPPAGRAVAPRETVPQQPVRPGTGPADTLGPMDWNDLVLHTGEARGLADTAYHSLGPGAPTLGAAQAGEDPEIDGVGRVATSDGAPD